MMTPQEIFKELELNYGYELNEQENKEQYEWLTQMVKDVSEVVNKNDLSHSISGSYWVLLNKDKVPPVIYGGVIPCFSSRKLAKEAMDCRERVKGWKIKRVNLNYR